MPGLVPGIHVCMAFAKTRGGGSHKHAQMKMNAAANQITNTRFTMRNEACIAMRESAAEVHLLSLAHTRF